MHGVDGLVVYLARVGESSARQSEGQRIRPKSEICSVKGGAYVSLLETNEEEALFHPP
jgi:hypothetical protein